MREREKYELFSYLISRLGKINSRKSLQKLVYFIEAAGVPLEYNFRMHLYGPYCEELTYDIPDLESEGVIAACEGERGWTVYKPGEMVGYYLTESSIDFGRYKELIDKVVDEFGSELPDELELLATTHKVAQDLQELFGFNENSVIKSVFKIKKEKFSEDRIGNAIERLSKAELLKIA